MRISEDNLTFRARRSADPYRLLLWAGLILAGLWLLVQVDNDKIVVFQATPTPTRTAGSFSQEGQAWFAAGNLDAAIEAYDLALEDAPNDPRLLAEQAQIQVYSSALRTTDAERKELLLKARANIELAAELAPRDSFVHAIRALVLDWNANPNLVTADERTDLLFQAENAAVLARELDNNNALALAYYAEILLDGGKVVLAEESILSALDANDQLMDVHRIYGQVLETKGLYVAAIEEYERAAGLAPNLTFLYLYVGYNYRQLALEAQAVDINSPVAKERFEQALDAFARAASINSQIGVNDPIPYLAIAKTYAQQGEFFVAARNGEKALEFDPENPSVYGQLGRIYMQARNYETALPTLKCAVVGCTAEENEVGGVQVEPLALTSLEVAYYYVFYDSVLSALNKCSSPDVTFVRDELRKNYGDDAVIPSIIAENEEICRILAQSDQ